MQHEIIRLANAAVASITFNKYPSLFTREDVEDIASTTILKACRSIDRYDPSRKLSTWIGSIASNSTKDALDYKCKRTAISQSRIIGKEDGELYDTILFGTYRGDEYDADRNLFLEEFNSAVDNCTRRMSEKDKLFFDMMEDEMKPREIAAVIGCSSNAAAVRSCNIRKKLEQPLAQVAREFGFTFIKEAS